MQRKATPVALTKVGYSKTQDLQASLDFIKFLAPPQPQFDVGATINILKSDIILSASGRWAAFDKDPKDQRAVENVIFKPITNIFEKVVDAILIFRLGMA
jgi:hypothetical protein